MARTERNRRAEVEAWRASGLSMAQFASRRDYSRSSLEKWARALRDEEVTAEAPRFVRLEVAGTTGATAELVVEVGGAQLRVRRGFDPGLLADVVAALSEGAS